MEEGHLDRVQVDVAGEIVELTWDEREALLDRLRNVHGRETIIAKFQAVEASRTVVLEPDEWEPVRSVLQFWEQGPDGLPIGLVGLLSALVRAESGGSVGPPSIEQTMEIPEASRELPEVTIRVRETSPGFFEARFEPTSPTHLARGGFTIDTTAGARGHTLAHVLEWADDYWRENYPLDTDATSGPDD